MNHPDQHDEHPLPSAEPDEYLTSSSILDWIDEINASTPTSSTSQAPASPQGYQSSPTLRTKRRRNSDSLPSIYLGDRRSSRKRRRLSQNMAGNMSPPSTPLSKVTPISGEPHTPVAKGTPLKSVEALKDLKNADTLGELMSDNGLMFDDKAAFNKYPYFKDKIFDIIRQERDSVMRPGSYKKFEAYLDCYVRYNEATFLRKMFPLLMKDGLHLREEGLFTNTEKQQLGQGEYLAYRDFLIDEEIMDTADREFLRTLVPSSCNRDCELYMAKVLAKAAGMTNPKPDYTFGLQRDQFPREGEAMVPEYITALLNIAPGTRHAFLIVEGKPYDGVKAEAENQARRGGATLVHAERILRGLVEDVADIEGPDEKSFVFSVIMDPDIVEFWVHWYEGKGPGQLGKFHMNRLASRNLVEEEQREDIRRKMHNIME